MVGNTSKFDPALAKTGLVSLTEEDPNKFDDHSSACIRSFIKTLAAVHDHSSLI